MILKSIVIILILNSLCEAYKILLVFPVPGRSHAILGEGYVRHLLNDGHEVTYITPITMKNSHPKLRQIDVSTNFELMPTDILFNIKSIINNELNYKDSKFLLYANSDFANSAINHPNVQRLIQDSSEHFDVVIAEWLYTELYAGFSSVFNCPLIWSSSMEPDSMVLDLIDEALNPAYNPHILSDKLPPFSFFDRVNELWILVDTKIFKWRLRHRENIMFNTAFESSVAKRGRKLPPFNEVRYNGSLVLGNSHIASGAAVHLPYNYKRARRYYQNLQKIMDDAKNGLIYFSMGSMLKSRSIPMEIKRGLLTVFSKLNQSVLWKFEEELPDLPKNVHIVPWAPQLGILAHPNCKLFITHGGLLSILESLHFAVPVIGIPMYGDQHLNINRAVEKGFGKRVDLNSEIATQMDIAIKEILNEPRFVQKLKEYSLIFHDRLNPPGKVLSYWVSHVIRTKGAPHLRSPGMLVPWYQKLYLDLAFLILVTLYISFKVLIKVITVILSFRSGINRIKKKLL
ncbi:unnamed protein product [Parnassius apollo]|uniref:UDP-glucuronosyltransferase n=1 Tax=Parnassius apollo TaxID=110799 RepID=A0A8S3Y338_PARAO|nr:unnamed protein product [Parnassius apollo]